MTFKQAQEEMKKMTKLLELEVAGYIVSHPDQTLDQIAEHFEIAKARVRRIKKRAKLPNSKPGRKIKDKN